jgi:hypothetical protein
MSESPSEHLTWLQTFQDLLRYYLAPVQNTPLVNVSGLIAVGLGLFLAFRCWKFERFVVSVCGVFVGAWLGYWVSRLIGMPAPIPAAVGVVVVTLLAYRTYRWWLAAGSVVVLFSVALVFQLGQGDLKRYLPDLGDPGRPLRGDWIDRLPADAAEQGRNLRATWSDQIAKVKEPVLRELKALGPVGWLLPVGAALIGGLLAYWALRGFAVVWVGYLGANVAVLGALTFLSAHWPGVQTWVISKPQYPAGCIIGVWLLGLILQAKEIRFPKKSPPEPAAAPKEPAKA